MMQTTPSSKPHPVMIIDAIPSRSNWKSNVTKRKTSPTPKFAFITTTGPPTKAREDEVASRLVRMQAMRSFLTQKESNARTTSPTRPTQVSLVSKRVGSAGKFKLASWSRKRSRRGKNIAKEAVEDNESPHVKTTIGEDLGPFEILQIPLTPLTRRLLHHCQCGPDPVIWANNES